MTNGRVQVQSIKVKTAHPGQVTYFLRGDLLVIISV